MTDEKKPFRDITVRWKPIEITETESFTVKFKMPDELEDSPLKGKWVRFNVPMDEIPLVDVSPDKDAKGDYYSFEDCPPRGWMVSDHRPPFVQLVSTENPEGAVRVCLTNENWVEPDPDWPPEPSP